jgi:hypothetical protein
MADGTNVLIMRCGKNKARDGYGSAHMMDADYYRRQADVCTRLALACTDEQVADRLKLLTMEFIAKAAEAERSKNAGRRDAAPPSDPSQ